MVVIGVILIFIVLFVVLMYNSLVDKKNQVENAFGGMDVQLKKRYDLIPNLISSVKTYMKHESDTLTEITELRTKALSGGISDDEKVELDKNGIKLLAQKADGSLRDALSLLDQVIAYNCDTIEFSSKNNIVFDNRTEEQTCQNSCCFL